MRSIRFNQPVAFAAVRRVMVGVLNRTAFARNEVAFPVLVLALIIVGRV